MKRYLYLAHRWLGILLCVFMALWFLSGVVMMYVGYPKLTPQEHWQRLPVLDGGVCCLAAGEALAALPTGSVVRTLRLTSIAGTPVYVATLDKNRFAAIDGRSGALRPLADAALAVQSAQAFMPVMATYAGLVDEDTWTHSRVLDGHRPLHRVDMQDEARTRLYVSSVTGEVVRDATLTERRWNWIGAWLHWLYPLRGGWFDDWWSGIVIYSSLAATVLGLTGLWAGCLRWRRRPYASGSHSPYRAPWARWHHWLGLAFGGLIVTWIASGLLSMNPWKIFDAGGPRPPMPVVQVADNEMSPAAMLACLEEAAGFAASELSWVRLADESFILARAAGGSSRLLSPGRCAPFREHEQASLLAAGAAMLPHARVSDVFVQQAYDWHYYSRAEHTMGGHQNRPLPVLRLQFDDPAQTWLYLDPRSGAVVQRLNSHGRVKRWLFALLHSWDWQPLLARRPLWDLLLIVGSLGGFAVSVSGVVLGWRRLCRR